MGSVLLVIRMDSCDFWKIGDVGIWSEFDVVVDDEMIIIGVVERLVREE